MVVEIGERLELSSAGTQARQRNGELRFPAMAQQVLRVGSKTEGFAPPVAQSEQRPNAQPPKAGRVGAFRRLESPIEIPLRAGGM